MAVTSKKFNWVRSPGAWQQMQAWRARRAEHTANFQAAANMAATAFANANLNRVTGLGELAANAAAARVQSEIGTRLNTIA